MQGSVRVAVRTLLLGEYPVGGTGGSGRYGRAGRQLLCREGGTPEGPVKSRAYGAPPRLISCERCCTTRASTTVLYSTAVLGDR